MEIPVTVDSLLDKVKQMAPIIRGYADEAEEARRLARPEAGLYRMAGPKAFGGLELEPLTPLDGL
jgi:hypothetical protein